MADPGIKDLKNNMEGQGKTGGRVGEEGRRGIYTGSFEDYNWFQNGR